MNENTDSTALCSPNVECDFSNEIARSYAGKGIDQIVRVSIHSIRRRLADSDGISGKAALDGIVNEGILQDDSTKFVSEVRFSQEKTKGAEYTVITLETVSR